nr:hypothetical protein [Tanacetum cinerariifolium]
MYMAKVQEVSPDAVDSGPIFDTEPEQKVQNDDHYDVFAIECQHPEQSKSIYETYLIEKDAHNVLIESVDMNFDSEQIDQNDEDADHAKEQLKRRDIIEYASEMELECAKVRDMQNKLSAHQDTISILKQQKDTQLKLYKTREDKELDKVIELENKVKAPESDEVIRLEKESRSKLSDLIRPFDYAKLNSLYDLFVPQREKSSEQRYFSERSRMSHILVQKKSENFRKYQKYSSRHIS